MPSIELKFKNINAVNNKVPIVRVMVNDTELLHETVKTKMATPLTLHNQNKNVLRIYL